MGKGVIHVTVRELDPHAVALRYCAEHEGIADARVTTSYASETAGWQIVLVYGTKEGLAAERVYAVSLSTGEVR